MYSAETAETAETADREGSGKRLGLREGRVPNVGVLFWLIRFLRELALRRFCGCGVLVNLVGIVHKYMYK
jgi:hypothetical protein